MKEGIQDRLGAFIRHKGLTNKDFDLAVGLSNGTSARIGTTVRKSTINRIATAFPDLNTSWLLTGEGEMLRTPPAGTVMRVGDNNSGQVAQGGGSISLDSSAYLEIIREQQRQMSKMQEQYDRLLSILEKMQQCNGSG